MLMYFLNLQGRDIQSCHPLSTFFGACPGPVFSCVHLRNSTLGTESEISNLEAKIFLKEIFMLALDSFT